MVQSNGQPTQAFKGFLNTLFKYQQELGGPVKPQEQPKPQIPSEEQLAFIANEKELQLRKEQANLMLLINFLTTDQKKKLNTKMH